MFLQAQRQGRVPSREGLWVSAGTHSDFPRDRTLVSDECLYRGLSRLDTHAERVRQANADRGLSARAGNADAVDSCLELRTIASPATLAVSSDGAVVMWAKMIWLIFYVSGAVLLRRTEGGTAPPRALGVHVRRVNDLDVGQRACCENKRLAVVDVR
jgi:hypothetical protein